MVMSALLIDIVVYGVPVAIGLGALKLIHYYGGQPPRKDPKDKDETDKPDQGSV
jgi:hypothetical protein